MSSAHSPVLTVNTPGPTFTIHPECTWSHGEISNLRCYLQVNGENKLDFTEYLPSEFVDSLRDDFQAQCEEWERSKGVAATITGFAIKIRDVL